jgi:hypothetical protein
VQLDAPAVELHFVQPTVAGRRAITQDRLARDYEGGAEHERDMPLVGEFNNTIVGCLRFVETRNRVAKPIDVAAKRLEILAGTLEFRVVAFVLVEADRVFDRVDLLEHLRDCATHLVGRCPSMCRLVHEHKVGTKHRVFKSLGRACREVGHVKNEALFREL